MSELKCPACGNVLSEPLPKRCPVCQLEGINKMFLTLEDYKNWKKKILDVHIGKLRNHRVSVGYDGVLVLLGDGRLFGFGNNTQGQYCPRRIGEKIDTPEKIADNVISVAAGYNYSIYLDANGKLHFLGNSGIPFKERFDQGSLIFKEVYAKNNKDVFWAVDKNGEVYIWGTIKDSRRLLKKFEPIETQFTTYESSWWRYCDSYETQTDTYVFDSHSKYHRLDDITLSIKSRPDYIKFSKKYGEDNLQIVFSTLEKEFINSNFYDNYDHFIEEGKSFREANYIVVLQPEVYFLNRYIFQPVKIISDILNRDNRNQAPNDSDYDLNQGKKFWAWSSLKTVEKNFIKKCIKYNSSDWLCLDNNGVLHFLKLEVHYVGGDGYCEDFYERGQIGNVADCSACVEQQEVYFIDFNKKLWRNNAVIYEF